MLGVPPPMSKESFLAISPNFVVQNFLNFKVIWFRIFVHHRAPVVEQGDWVPIICVLRIGLQKTSVRLNFQPRLHQNCVTVLALASNDFNRTQPPGIQLVPTILRATIPTLVAWGKMFRFSPTCTTFSHGFFMQFIQNSSHPGINFLHACEKLVCIFTFLDWLIWQIG